VCQFSNCLLRPYGRFFYYYFMAGSVAMYFRQQRYPPPRLISYKIAGIRTLWEDVVPLCRLSDCPLRWVGIWGIVCSVHTATDDHWILPRCLPCSGRAGDRLRLRGGSRYLLQHAPRIRILRFRGRLVGAHVHGIWGVRVTLSELVYTWALRRLGV